MPSLTAVEFEVGLRVQLVVLEKFKETRMIDGES